jgi:hypothetical protein
MILGGRAIRASMRSTILRPVRSRVMWFAETANALARRTVRWSNLRGGRAISTGEAIRKVIAA